MRSGVRNFRFLPVVLALALSGAAAYAFFGGLTIEELMKKFGIVRVDSQIELNDIALEYALSHIVYPQRLFGGGADLDKLLNIDTTVDRVQTPSKGVISPVAADFKTRTENILPLIKKSTNDIEREKNILNSIAQTKRRVLEEIGKIAADAEDYQTRHKAVMEEIKGDMERFQQSSVELYAGGVDSEEYGKLVADNMVHINEALARRNVLYVKMMDLLSKRARLTHLLGIMAAEQYKADLLANLRTGEDCYDKIIFRSQ